MAGGVRWRNRQNPPSDADVRAVPSGHREPWQAPAAQEKSSSGNFPPSQLRRFFDLEFFSKSNDDFGLRRFFKGAALDFNFFSMSDAVYGTAGRSIAIHREWWQATAAQEKSSSRKFRPSRLRRFFDLDFFQPESVTGRRLGPRWCTSLTYSQDLASQSLQAQFIFEPKKSSDGWRAASDGEIGRIRHQTPMSAPFHRDIGSRGRHRPPKKNRAREISRRLDLNDFST